MDQQRAAHGLSLRVLLRLLLLAGAAVLGWFVLSGGPAQAEDAGQHSRISTAAVSQTVSSAPEPQGTSGTLHRTAAVVTGPLRNGPGRAADVVDRSTAPAPEPLRRAVHTVVTSLQPTLTTTTRRVADVVDRSATTVDTAVQPVLQATGLGTQPTVAMPASLAVAALHRASPKGLGEALSAGRHAVSLDAIAAAVGVGNEALHRVVQGLGDTELPGLPSGHDLPGAPSSGTVALAGMLAGLALLLPTLLRRRLAFDGAALPAGPAYPPGSSPG